MPSAPTTSLDLASPEVLADPYPWFAQERRAHPVALHEPSGLLLTFSHAAAAAVLRDRRLGRIWRDREPDVDQSVGYLEPFNLLHRDQMMENEPPRHTRLRRIVAGAFNRGHVERLRPRVRSIAERLLEDTDSAGFDVIGQYAEPLPVLVIADLLGVDPVHIEDLRRWSQAIVAMYEVSPRPATVEAAVAAAQEFADLVRALIAERRRRPRPDLVSDLAASDLSDDEVVAAVVLLLNAGHEASVNVFGNGLVAMLGRGLAPGADLAATVEEMLRFDSALQLFERTAIEDVDLGPAGGGVVVAAGDRVAALLGAANRDPAVFECAEEMDVARDPNPHLAFGAGVHFCLGAPLARMELVESLGVLWAAYPALALTGEPLSRGTFVLRGFRKVLVAGGRS